MCLSTGNFESIFFSQSYALFELRNLAKMKDITVFLVSATPLKPLGRISWNFVVFFLGFTPFLNFEIWRKWKILLKQLVSRTPLKPLNRIAWNFVVMKDIMCRYAFFTENADLLLLRSNLYPLFCPIARP